MINLAGKKSIRIETKFKIIETKSKDILIGLPMLKDLKLIESDWPECYSVQK